MVSSANRKLFRVGGPFIAFMLAGSYGLTYFTDIRYWVTRNKQLYASIPTDGSDHKVKTLSEIYQEEIAEKNFDDWENVRAPRPWEPETIRANQERAQQLHQKRIRERLQKIEEHLPADPKSAE